MRNSRSGQTITILQLSKTLSAVTARLRRLRAAPLPYVRIVIGSIALGCLLGLLGCGAARATSAESTPLQQLAKTLEGEHTQPASHLFHRHPLGFDAQTVQTVLMPVSAPRRIAATAIAVVDEERQKLGSSTGMVFLNVFAGLTLTLLLVRRRVDASIAARMARLETQILPSYRPVVSAIGRFTTTVFPGLMLLLLLLLSQAFLEQEGLVFTLLVKLLALWTGTAGLLCLAREFFLGPLAISFAIF